MKLGECIALCVLTCAISGAAFADYTNSPNYTGVSNGKSSTVGTYGSGIQNTMPHETKDHYTPAHFDNSGNYHESHQSYGHWVDPYSTPSNSSGGRHRRNGYGY